jgi:hypothetical protein
MTDNKKYDKGSLGWLREQAKKDGFDNIRNWQIWKRDQNNKSIFYNELEERYGKEFVDWAIQNRDKVPDAWLNAGCKTRKEYDDKCARDAGFKDNAERYRDSKREWRHETGRRIPMELYDECESHTGICIGEDKIARPVLHIIFEEVDKKKFNNPGFEFICQNPIQEFLDRFPQFKLDRSKGYKIDVKTAHFLDEYWKYRIDYNNIADYFLLIGLGTIGNTPQHILFVHKNDIIRNIRFWRRVNIKIGKNHLSEFKKFEITDILDKLNLGE